MSAVNHSQYYASMHSNGREPQWKKLAVKSSPWMYLTTLTLRPYLEMVVSTSPALFLQGRLWGGHQEVMALKSSCRSSFWASSSAGDTKLHSFAKIWGGQPEEKVTVGVKACLLWVFCGENAVPKDRQTWTKTFCRRALRSPRGSSVWVAAGTSGMWGRSKNKYRHLTSVEGTDMVVIQSTVFCRSREGEGFKFRWWADHVFFLHSSTDYCK